MPLFSFLQKHVTRKIRLREETVRFSLEMHCESNYIIQGSKLDVFETTTTVATMQTTVCLEETNRSRKPAARTAWKIDRPVTPNSLAEDRCCFTRRITQLPNERKTYRFLFLAKRDPPLPRDVRVCLARLNAKSRVSVNFYTRSSHSG